VLANGTVRPEDEDLIVDRITWNIGSKEVNYVFRSDLILMDILANFNWDRPLYFSVSSGSEAYFGLEEYFQLDGMAYRLVPIKSKVGRGYIDIGRVNTTTLPDNLLNVFPYHARVDVINNPEREQKPVAPYLWGGFNDKRVYLPEETTRMFSNLKSMYLRTAEQLVEEGDIEKAEQIHDKLIEIFNPDVIPYIIVSNMGHSLASVQQADALLKLDSPTAKEKAHKIIDRILDELKDTYDWFEKCDERTILIREEKINYLTEFLIRIDDMLSAKDEIPLFQDKMEQLKLTKTLQILASQLSSSIDFYSKKGMDAQRDLYDSFLRLNRVGTIAVITADSTLEEFITNLMEVKINMISNVDPQMGRVLQNYFLQEPEEF